MNFGDIHTSLNRKVLSTQSYSISDLTAVVASNYQSGGTKPDVPSICSALLKAITVKLQICALTNTEIFKCFKEALKSSGFFFARLLH